MRISLAVLLVSAASMTVSPVFPAAPIHATRIDPHMKFDARGNVARFYGVPMNLTISNLKRLPYRVKMGHEHSEGEKYTTATINAEDGVQVKVSFGSDRKLYDAETASRDALGPKAIGVGSLLSDVRAAWPAGRLLYGVEENKGFVTFVTGTNVMYSFDPKDMPLGTFLNRGSVKDVPNIRVQSIRLSHRPVSVPDACVPGYCL